jgi:hypothetical protein
MAADLTNSPQHWLEAAITNGTAIPPVVTALEIPAAITGGEAPTEAEYNTLLAFVTEIYNDLVSLGLLVND